MKNNNFNILIGILTIISTTCQIHTQKKLSEIQAEKIDYREIYPDTWVVTDALGRTMPPFKEVGTVKSAKTPVKNQFGYLI